MSVPELSVRRPVTVLMAALAVAIFGTLAARRLPVELLPDLSYPTITVQTEYPDAAPFSVEQFVTRPVEEAVGVINGVREMRSVSRPGISEVVLEFEWKEKMDLAALEVREKLGAIRLPREAEVPRVLRFDPSLDPILRLAFSGDRPLDELRQLADRWLKLRLEAVRGVAAARVRGGLDPEVVVEADEEKLAALGLTLDDLAGALEAENVNTPGGTLRDYNALYLVRTLHEFTSLRQLDKTVVRDGSEGRVRVEDVATVHRGHRDRDEISHLDGREVVEIDIHREGSANTVTVARAVREAMTSLGDEMPPDLHLSVLSDQSLYIADAVGQVKTAAELGGLLAVVVLFFFLRDLLSTVIIALSIPLSVVATFLPMQQAGVSLNIMSLGGLALGVGMLVDSSIVVLEAIDRRRLLGAARRQAAIQGASEVAGAVVASTLTTVAVFFPIVFVRGVAGQLFRDQALTVCFSLLTSLVVALTLIPALAAFDPAAFRPRRGDTPEGRPWTFRLGGWVLPSLGDGVSPASRLLTVVAFLPRLLLLLALALLAAAGAVAGRLFFALTSPITRLFDRLAASYPGALRRALHHRWAVVGAGFLLLGASVAAVPFLGTQLVPDLAQGQFAFQLRLPEGTPLGSTAETVAGIEQPLLASDRFQRVFSVIGSLPSSASGRRTLGENLAQIDLVLPPGVPAAEEAQAVELVRRELARRPRVEAELVRPSVLVVESPVAVRILGDDLDRLDQAVSIVQRRVAAIPGVTDVTTTSEPGSPEVQVELDRERAASLGLSAATIGAALRRKIRGDVIGQFREGEERIDIRLRSSERYRDQASEVGDLRLRLDNGTVVPVSAVARLEVGRGPAAIHRAEGSRMAEVTARTSAANLGSVLASVREAVAALTLGPGLQAEMSGQDTELEVSFSSLRLALALAVFLVYVVMAAQFESLVHPLVILTSVPLALVGVVAALLLTGRPVSVLVLIGTVMLAGIVVNNAIVLVDAINRRRREGEDLREALLEAGAERLRPILMTTTTTVLGLAPMALGLGAGDELRAPLAVTVIGGLLTSTVLTLVVVPCVYRLFSRPPSTVTAEGLAGEPDPDAALPERA